MVEVKVLFCLGWHCTSLYMLWLKNKGDISAIKIPIIKLMCASIARAIVFPWRKNGHLGWNYVYFPPNIFISISNATCKQQTRQELEAEKMLFWPASLQLFLHSKAICKWNTTIKYMYLLLPPFFKRWRAVSFIFSLHNTMWNLRLRKSPSPFQLQPSALIAPPKWFTDNCFYRKIRAVLQIFLPSKKNPVHEKAGPSNTWMAI